MLHKEKIRQLVRIAESDNSGIVTAWDLRDWSEADIQLFEQEKYLLFRGYADSVRCDRCHKGCTVEPTIARYPDGQQKGVLLCTDNDEGGRIEFEMEELRYWEINIKKLSAIKSDHQDSEQGIPQRGKNRPTKVEMDNRNRTVLVAVVEIQGKYNRLPTVEEIMSKTGFERQQVYATDAYKEGKIAKASAKTTSEMTGSSVADSEYFTEKSERHGRAKRRSRTKQVEIDALIDDQDRDDKSDYVR